MHRKQNGEAITERIIIVIQGAAISLIVTVALCAVSSLAVLGGIIGEHVLVYISLAVILLSSLIGSLTISYRLHSIRMLSSVAGAVVYALSLCLCAIAIFDSPLRGTCLLLAGTICAGIAASLIAAEKGRGAKKRNKRIRM